MNSTYLSGDDSRLLREVLRSVWGGAVLEIGTGCGSNLQAISRRFEVTVGTDIQKADPLILGCLGEADLIRADTAKCFRNAMFDLVFFNPPYLPSRRIVDAAIDGGKNGFEIPKKFLTEALRVLRPGGSILFLLSSESSLKEFREFCNRNKLRSKVVARQKLFYEELFVFRLSKE